LRAAQVGSRWPDRVAGVLLGLVLGIAVVAAFVFLGSEATIDAPRISGVEGGGQGDRQSRPPVVRVIGGAPPAAGPLRLDARQGERVRFAVDSDIPIEISVPGYGVHERVGTGRATIEFRAMRPGQYPVIVAQSKIAVATLRVAGR
jgi:hypothetical protein